MTITVTRKELEARTIMELRSFAREHEISLRRNWKKDEIVQAILRMVRPKRGRKPKPVQRPAAAAGSAATRPKPHTGNRRGIPDTGANQPLPGSGRKRTPRIETTSESELALMVRNANTLFAYWRTPEPPAGDADTGGPRTTLRIHDLSGSADGHPGKDYYDIPVQQPSGTLYIALRMPGHRFIAEVGDMREGVFRRQASSTEAQTPLDRAFPPSVRSLTFFRLIYGMSEGTPLLLEDMPAVFSGDG